MPHTATGDPMKPSEVAVARLSGDICTKGRRTRQAFHRQLKANVKDALNRAHVDYSMELADGRIDVAVHEEGGSEELCRHAARVFGIASVVPGRAYPWETLQDIVDIGKREFGEAVKGKTYAVRTRRSGNSKRSIGFKSPDVDRALGAALGEGAAGVDLENPQFTARVDVRAEDVVFYSEEMPGPRGLPIGVEGKGLALVSGGFDSTVAAWKTMGRGVDLDFLFFNLGGAPHEQGLLDLLRPFVDSWCYGVRPNLVRVDFRPMVGELQAKVPGRYWQVLLKRLFLIAADIIAAEGGYQTLVTGDAIGQVSSQTLFNLAAVSAPIESLVLRPLVGYDKDEIVALSRVVGTHDVAAVNPEYCSLDAGKPATKCSAAELDRQQERLDLEILRRLVADRRTDRVDHCDDVADRDVRVHELGEGDVVLDLREGDLDPSAAIEGAVHLPFGRAIDAAMMLPKPAHYVLVCEVGLKSAFLAEQMRTAGWNASSFAGGIGALQRWLRRNRTGG